MSALPPKADIPQRRLDVRFVPKADIGRNPLECQKGLQSADLGEKEIRRGFKPQIGYALPQFEFAKRRPVSHLGRFGTCCSRRAKSGRRFLSIRAVISALPRVGFRCRICFSRRAAKARRAADVGSGLRAARVAAGSGRRVSIFAKRRCPLISLRRPTMR